MSDLAVPAPPAPIARDLPAAGPADFAPDTSAPDTNAPADRAPAIEPGGPLDVVYVLSLLQVAFLMLAAIGEQLLMGGNPAYLALPVVKIALLLVLATKALRGRRWALRGLVILQWITVAGFGLQLIGGLLLPGVDFSVNVVVLMTNLGLPIAVILLCRPYLRAFKRARRAAAVARAYPVPQDPYAAATVELPR